MRHDTAASDLAVAYRDRAGVLYRDRLNGKYEAIPLDGRCRPARPQCWRRISITMAFRIWSALPPAGVALIENHEGKLQAGRRSRTPRARCVFADLENRGVGDLIAGRGVYRNQGQGKFERQDAPLAGLTSGAALAAADFDGDGRVDLAADRRRRRLHVLENQTATRTTGCALAISGVKNLKLAPGATVEVKTGASYQKKIYDGRAAAVRAGRLQGRRHGAHHLAQRPDPERAQAAGRLTALNFKEAQRLSGSCPMIFTWNGKRFQFITDVLGVAPLGASSGDGQYFPGGSRRVRADSRRGAGRERRQLRDPHHRGTARGFVSRSGAVDRGRSSGGDGNFHQRQVQVAAVSRVPVVRRGAADLSGGGARFSGRDVLRAAARRDRTYPDGFRRDYTGVAELHTSISISAARRATNHAVLILNGWVDWADGSTFLRAPRRNRKAA